jgi:glycerol-3-phosphate dehydrogenase
VGGKWTTFRAFAAQVADQLLDALNSSRRVYTDDLAIGGGKDYPKTDHDREQWLAAMQERRNLSRERLQTLLDRYGTRAELVADFISVEADTPLQRLPVYSRREIQFIARHEKVIHLDDLILRRTLMGILGQVNGELLRELAAASAPELGWSAEQTHMEVTRTNELLRVRHGVDLPSPSLAHR